MTGQGDAVEAHENGVTVTVCTVEPEASASMGRLQCSGQVAEMERRNGDGRSHIQRLNLSGQWNGKPDAGRLHKFCGHPPPFVPNRDHEAGWNFTNAPERDRVWGRHDRRIDRTPVRGKRSNVLRVKDGKGQDRPGRGTNDFGVEAVC